MRFERGANKRNRDGGWFPTTDLLLISRPSNAVAAANVFFRFDLFSKTDLVLISIQWPRPWFLKWHIPPCHVVPAARYACMYWS